VCQRASGQCIIYVQQALQAMNLYAFNWTRSIWSLFGIALLLLLPALMNQAHGYSDRRQIIAFGTPGSLVMDTFEQLIAEHNCRLVDRDVDIRIVDVRELDPLDEKSSAESVLGELLKLRAKHDVPFELVLIGKDSGLKMRSEKPDALLLMFQIDCA